MIKWMAFCLLAINPLLVCRASQTPTFASLARHPWQGQLFFMNCFFEYRQLDDAHGLVKMCDEFGNETSSRLQIVSPYRFIDEDHQDFTIEGTEEAVQLLSTHLPPINLRPLEKMPPRPVVNRSMTFPAALGAGAIALLALLQDSRQRSRIGRKPSP